MEFLKVKIIHQFINNIMYLWLFYLKFTHFKSELKIESDAFSSICKSLQLVLNYCNTSVRLDFDSTSSFSKSQTLCLRVSKRNSGNISQYT